MWEQLAQLCHIHILRVVCQYVCLSVYSKSPHLVAKALHLYLVNLLSSGKFCFVIKYKRAKASSLLVDLYKFSIDMCVRVHATYILSHGPHTCNCSWEDTRKKIIRSQSLHT